MQSSQTNQQQQQQQNAPGAAPNGVAGGAGLPQGGTAQSNQAPATQTTGATGTATTSNYAQVNGGRFDFDDGGTFCGGWEDGKAHGHGVCTGPKGQGAYAGSWHYGFEVSGVYTWPSGSVYEGQWQNGKRHGLGMETRGGWLYRGEWTQGFKGRYGVKQSTTSTARYEGTWSNGLQDGYGSETYADSGSYQGQWSHGCRHGYGVRASAPFGLANHYKPKQQMRSSMTSLKSADGGPISSPTPEPNEKRDRRDDSRGGFVLKARSDDPPPRRKSLTEKSLKKGILANLKIRKQKSTGDLEKRGTGGSIRSNASSTSWMSTESSQSQASALIHSDSNASFVFEDDQMDASVVETYSGEWVEDKRTGFGISERSNGLRYEGQWFNNTKYGYGVTTLRDGSKEEGKYKNNVLITSQKKKHMFLIRSAKFRERIEAAVNAAQRASKIALQKADIAISRTATARGKAELADIASEHAREDAEIALQTANQFAPDFRPPGLERLKNREIPKYVPLPPPQDANTGTANANKAGIDQQKLQHGQQDTSSTPLKTRMQNETTTSTIMSDVTQTITPSNRRTSMRPAGIPLTNQNPNMLNMIPNQIPLGSSPNQIPLNSGMLNAQGATTSPDPNQQLINNLMSQNPISGQQQVAQANQPSTSNYINTHQNNSYMPFQNPADYYSGYQQPPINQGYPLPQGYPSQQMLFPLPPVMYGPMTLAQMNQVGPQLYGPGMNQYVQSMYNQQQQQPQQQQTQQLDQNDGTVDTQRPPNTTSIRRNSRVLSPQDRPMTGGIGQTLNDRLDHYKRPPSRDSSVDRYARAHSRLTGSRQPSVDKTVANPVPDIPDSRSIRGPSVARGGTPLNGSVVGSGAATPVYAASNTSGQFEGALLRNRNLGQDILPSPGQPKRTESLYVAPVRGSGGGGGGGGGTGGSKDNNWTVPAFASSENGHDGL